VLQLQCVAVAVCCSCSVLRTHTHTHTHAHTHSHTHTHIHRRRGGKLLLNSCVMKEEGETQRSLVTCQCVRECVGDRERERMCVCVVNGMCIEGRGIDTEKPNGV